MLLLGLEPEELSLAIWHYHVTCSFRVLELVGAGGLYKYVKKFKKNPLVSIHVSFYAFIYFATLDPGYTQPNSKISSNNLRASYVVLLCYLPADLQSKA